MSLMYRLRDELNLAMVRQRIRGARAWLRRHNLLMGIIFIVCIVGSWTAIALTSRRELAATGPIRPQLAYYWDLNTGALFTAPMGEVAIEAPSGPLPGGAPAGVRAFVYACGSCEDTSQHRVGYLTMRSPKAQSEPVDGVIVFDARTDQLVAEPASHFWHPLASDEGRTLLRAPVEVCRDQGPLMVCLPER